MQLVVTLRPARKTQPWVNHLKSQKRPLQGKVGASCLKLTRNSRTFLKKQIIISNGILDLVTGILAKISLGTGIWAKFRLGTGIWYPPSRPSNFDFKTDWLVCVFQSSLVTGLWLLCMMPLMSDLIYGYQMLNLTDQSRNFLIHLHHCLHCGQKDTYKTSLPVLLKCPFPQRSVQH